MPAASETRWSNLVRSLTATFAVAVLLWVLFLLLSAPIGNSPAVRTLLSPVLFELIETAAILLVAYLFARSIATGLEAHEPLEPIVSHAQSVRLFVNLAIGAGVILLLFLVFGTSLQSIFFGSAFLGLVLGLAGQTVLSNVFAGITLVATAPFRPGDRISIISASYGAIAPSHAHETLYPTYTGTVRDTGLMFTVLQLDNGRIATIPNSVVLQALVVNLTQTPFHSVRVRVTLPYAITVTLLEEVLREHASRYAPVSVGAPPPRVEVADVGPSTWDGVVLVWTVESNEEIVRDRVLRQLWPRLAEVAPPVVQTEPPRQTDM